MRHNQQLQFLQAQGLQRHPVPVAQPQFFSVFICSRSVIRCSFFALPKAGESAYSLRTMVQSQAISPMTIGKLAATGGVGVETIRFYQRRGLLQTPSRGDGVRRYGLDDVRRLRFIRQAQAAGFTLEEVKQLLDLDANDDRSKARTLAAERVKALDAQIGGLTAARNALKKLAKECGRGGSGPCPILSAFES